jgi:purine-binding chemotaxis protein CheW
MTVTKVPNAPGFVTGLINLRGTVISMLDLNLLLDIGRGDMEQQSTIILKLEDELVGITVDQVDEVLDIDEAIIENIGDDNKKAYEKGVINFNDRIVTFIDIDKLITTA